MSEFGNGYKWSQAATKALLLALVTIACNTISYLFPDSQVLSILLFIVRTVASVWLLVVFMKQFTATTGQSAMSFALCTVLLSSLICAFYDAACFAWLFPSMAEKVNEAMSQSMSMMPAEGQSVMERMMDFLFGLIVAAIANSSGKSKDPFAEEVKKEEDELA